MLMYLIIMVFPSRILDFLDLLDTLSFFKGISTSIGNIFTLKV